MLPLVSMTDIEKNLWPAAEDLSCQEQLDFDETFLDALDQSSHNNSRHIYLRFWELPSYHVVLGRSNQANIEAYEELCQKESVSIHKRPSGGGTVILGPGCLCYSLYAPTSLDAFSAIDKTNTHIMNTHQKALNKALAGIEVQGVSDLTYQDFKFSGNAQRRKKNSILFHGTFLYDFDLELISKLLQHPSKEPDYRQKKSHEDFVRNIPLDPERIKTLIRSEWESYLA